MKVVQLTVFLISHISQAETCFTLDITEALVLLFRRAIVIKTESAQEKPARQHSLASLHHRKEKFPWKIPKGHFANDKTTKSDKRVQPKPLSL